MSIRHCNYFQMAKSVCFQPDLSASPGREILFSLLALFCRIPRPVADCALSHTKPPRGVRDGKQLSCQKSQKHISCAATWVAHFVLSGNGDGGLGNSSNRPDEYRIYNSPFGGKNSTGFVSSQHQSIKHFKLEA